jgi:signal transduction histidine kinase
MNRFVVYLLLMMAVGTGCQSSVPPQAQQGLLDLRQWDFGTDGVVKLNGEWSFIWVTTQVLHHQTKATYISVPGAWNGQAAGSQRIPGQGTGIYRLRVLTNPRYKGTILGLRLPVISTAAKITINQATVFSAGSRSVPECKPDVVPFMLSDSVADITVLVHNYHHDKGGLRYPIQMGLLSDVQQLRYQSVARQFWLLGAILVMAFYHLGLFWIRRGNRAALYFSVFCFLIAVRILVTGDYIIRYLLPIDWFTIKRIEYLVFYLPFVGFTLFLLEIFPSITSPKIARAIIVLTAGCVVLVLVTPSVFYTSFIDYFYPVGTVMLGYGLYVVLRAVRLHSTGSIAILIGYLGVFLTYINDVFYVRGWLPTTELIAVGLFFFILCQAFLLLQRFSKAFADVEEANSELSAKNAIIETQNEELQRLNGELDSFVYRTSHDLRAPIASVMGLISITKDEEDLTKIREYLGLKNKTLKKLDRTIHDILDYSKNKRLTIEPEPVDFTALVTEVFDSHFFMENADCIEKTIDCQVTGTFYSDPRRLEMIFNNLISNAIKYYDARKPNPYIRVGITADVTQAEIVLADNGLGIGSEHHTKIFDMFYRTGDHVQSSGLGLYVVKDAITKLGGTITLQSTLGEGSTFRIRIPNLAAG